MKCLSFDMEYIVRMKNTDLNGKVAFSYSDRLYQAKKGTWLEPVCRSYSEYEGAVYKGGTRQLELRSPARVDAILMRNTMEVVWKNPSSL
jgi:hypothetical protein